MKKNLLLTLLVGQAFILYGQDESTKLAATNAETNRFYYFEIPSAINGSNIDPSAISNVTSNFTDSKLSIKLGFPSLFKDAPATKDLTNSGFIQVYAKATNGVATLWKANSQPVEFGLTGGYSRVLSHSYWVYLDDKKQATEKHSSEAMNWINVIGNYERGNYYLFNTSGTFSNILTKQTEASGSLYLSFNRYFFSQIKKYRILSCIWAVGIGYAKTNNYTSLKSRTFQEGKIVYNLDSSLSQSVVETTAGRNGSLIISEGLSSFGELYIPLVRNKKYGGLYFGNRLSFYSIGSNNNITNFNTGFYVNLKDRKIDGDKSAKDVINFSITGQFNQLNKSSDKEYIDKNFSILLQAAVPLRFN